MAQFRSSSREGSFKNNQLIQPDTISRIKEQGKRRLENMDSHQQSIRNQRQLLLQAQQTAQDLQLKGAESAFKAEQAAVNASAERTKNLWELQLKEEQAKDKFKVDKLGALINFSQTALNVTQQIVKANKENQLKAINQIAFKNNLTYQDAIDAAAIDQGISRAEFMRTAYVKNALAEGKSQEFINTMYDHLVKGGGYRNYMNNKSILDRLSRENAEEIRLVASNTSLSIEDREREIAALEAKQRANLTINGEIPDAKFLEVAYNPNIRKALTRAGEIINIAKTDQLEEQTRLDQNANILLTLKNDGPQGVFQLIANSPFKKGAITDAVNVITSQGQMTPEEISELRNTRFEVNGRVGTLEEFGYVEALAILDQEYNRGQTAIKENLSTQQKLTALEEEKFALKSYQKYLEGDNRFTQDEFNDYVNAADKKFGFNRSKTFDVLLEKETVSAQVKELMRQDLERRAMDGTLTNEYMLENKLPMDLYRSFQQYADRTDNVRADPLYKSIEDRVRAAMQGTDKLKFVEGKFQSDAAQWFLKDQTQKYKQKYMRASLGGATPQELNSILDLAAADTKEYLDGPENFTPDVGIARYNQYMSEQKVNQLAAERKLNMMQKLFADDSRNKNPNEWINAIGEAPLIEAVEELRTSGDSVFLRQLASELKLTPTEVANQLAEVSDKIEPVVVPANYQEMVDSWTPKQRFDLTSDITAVEKKIRTTRQLLNDESRMPLRGVYQSSAGSVRNLTGDFSEADTYGPGWGALSRVIRYAEGTASEAGYNTMFTHKRFDGFGDHPRQLQSSGRWTSDAAGAYQFLSTTWDGLGLTDFSPESQEIGARQLTQKKRGVDPDKVIKTKDEFRQVMDKLAPEWASLPYSKPSPRGFGNGSSYYGQGGKSLDDLWDLYQQSISNSQLNE